MPCPFHKSTGFFIWHIGSNYPIVQVLDDSTPKKVITPVSIEHYNTNYFQVEFSATSSGTIMYVKP